MLGYPLLAWLNFFSTLLPLGAGVVLWKRSSRSMKLVTGLLLLGFLNSLGLLVMTMFGRNNMILFHFYALLSYLIIALLFSYWHDGRTAFVLKMSIPLFFLVYGALLVLGFENWTHPNTYSMVIQSILVALIALYTLNHTLRRHEKFPVYQDERFWVSIAAFTLFAGPTLVRAMTPTYIIPELWQIFHVLVVLSHGLFFLGYVWMRRWTTLPS